MANMKVEINVKGSDRGGSQESSKSGISIPSSLSPKAISGGIKGAIKALGIASAIGFIVNIILSFKPLMSVLGNLGKMIGYLLAPIANAITVLLYPVLLLLKPIVRVVNQLMSPFIRLALQLMKEGKTGESTLVLFSGLSVVFIKLISEVVKFVGDSIIYLIGTIIGLVSKEAGDQIINNLIPAFNTLVDDQSAIMSAKMVLGLVNLLDNTNINLEGFITNSIDAIKASYPNISQQVSDSLDNVKKLAIDGDLDLAFSSLNLAMVNSFANFATNAGYAIASAFRAMITAIVGAMIPDPTSWTVEDFWKGTKRIAKALTKSALYPAFGFYAGTIVNNMYGQ
jgi:hypothetical protein